MKYDTLANAVAAIDDEQLISRDSFRSAKRRPLALRWMAAAAAFILLAGAVFAAIKLAPEKAAVPKEAVLPPVRVGSNSGSGFSYLRDYNVESGFEFADAVCTVTVGNWLSESDFRTYYEAVPETVYKGSLPEKIVIAQFGSSKNTVSPLYTYGDKLLLFLFKWDENEYENCYSSLTAEFGSLFIAENGSGEKYVLDLGEMFTYNTGKECPGVHLHNYADEALIEQLCGDLSKADPLMAEIAADYFDGEEGRIVPLHVYLLAELELLFEQM